MRIHAVSDTDMYPIRDTSLSWSIGVTEYTRQKKISTTTKRRMLNLKLRTGP
jgi:hypothetical protein